TCRHGRGRQPPAAPAQPRHLPTMQRRQASTRSCAGSIGCFHASPSPMHPAFSVIFFTVASGAGYGLLFLLRVGGALGMLPPDRWFGAAACGLAVGAVSFGLLASTFHLGHPERAWRAMSQWRSSWLSREGLASLITYAPTLLFAAGWILAGSNDGAWGIFGLVAAACAAVTRDISGMI